MSDRSTLERITKIAEAVTAALGFVLVDVHLGQTGNRLSLVVTIFCPGRTVGLDDCQAVSRALDKELDRQPLTGGSYLLEVQSPGIERQLESPREFAVFIGQQVSVLARETIGTLGLSFTGKLLESPPGRLLIGNPRPLPASLAVKRRQASKQADTAGYPDRLELDLNRLVRVKLYPEAAVLP